jgi:hypothetical protein
VAAASPASLTWASALAWRVRRHQLAERVQASGALGVVPVVCGLHAQVMSSAELTLWARTDGLAREAVGQALWEDRALVKTWAMRGTLHLLPATEYPTWQAALGTYRHYLKPSWFKAFGVTEAELERLIDAVTEALDGQMLTRQELGVAVEAGTGSAALGEKVRESWGAFLKPVSFRGGLCFAPDSGRNARFTRPDGWLGAWEPVDADAALREVVRRYLSAYGPATREDLGRWWAVSPAQAGRLIAALGDEVAAVEVEGTSGWMLTADVEDAAAAGPERTVNLLPAFDQWVVGASRDVSAMVAGDNRPRVYRPQGWLSPVVLVNGRIDGVWRHERKGARVLVEVEPFVKLPAWARKGVEAEAERLAGFLEGQLELSWTGG